MARVKSLAGLPIEQHHSPNVGGAMSDHRGSVLHIAEGTYQGTISWQMNPDQRYSDGTSVTTSSTWIIGKNRGEWAQMVDTDVIAWCQRSGSKTRNSIELAGHSGDRPTAWQVEACAQLFAWEHIRYGVPLQVADTDAVLGLCHHSADREWAGVEWGHEDCPGSGVIAAKPAIVARAKEIVNGGGFLMALTDAQQDELLAGVREIRMRAGFIDGRVEAIATGSDKMHDGFPTPGAVQWLPGFLKAIAAKVDVDPAELAAIGQAAQAGAAAALDARVEDLADRIAAKVPQEQRDMVKTAVKDALREGTGAAG